MTRALVPALALALALTACQAAPPPPVAFALAPAQGALEVAIAGPTRLQRQLQAALADVDKVVVGLGNPTNTVARAVTFDAAAIAGGTARTTFADLPADAYSVSITVYGAAPSPLSGPPLLGSDRHAVTLTAGEKRRIDADVLITPTVAAPRVLPDGAEAPGGVVASVTLRDDLPVVTPPIAGTWLQGVPDDDTGDLTLAADGAVWVTSEARKGSQDPFWTTGSNVNDWQGKLYRIAPGGAPAQVGAGDDHRLVRAAGAQVFTSQGSATFGVLGLAGAAVATPAFPGFEDVAQAPNGDVWAVSATYSPDAERQFTKLAPTTFAPVAGAGWKTHDQTEPCRLRFDGKGMLWALLATFNAGSSSYIDAQSWGAYDNDRFLLRRYDPATGRPVRTINIGYLRTGADLARDAAGNIWYVDTLEQDLIKLAPDGAELGRFHLPVRFNKVFIDHADRVWAYYGTHRIFAYPDAAARPDLLTRLTTAGVVEGYYHVGAGADITGLVVTPTDEMWVGTRSKGLIKLQVGS